MVIEFVIMPLAIFACFVTCEAVFAKRPKWPKGIFYARLLALADLGLFIKSATVNKTVWLTLPFLTVLALIMVVMLEIERRKLRSLSESEHPEPLPLSKQPGFALVLPFLAILLAFLSGLFVSGSPHLPNRDTTVGISLPNGYVLRN